MMEANKLVWLPKTNQQKALMSKENGEDGDNQLASRWPELTDLLLYSIFTRLHISDHAAFSGVCMSWRSFSTPLKREYVASQLPPLIMYYLPHKFRPYRFYSIKSNEFSRIELPKCSSIHCIGSYHGCLIMLEESHHHQDQPVVVSISTRKKILFPISNLPTDFATLSSPPTSPDCLLVSACTSGFHNYNLQCCQRCDTAWTVLLQSPNQTVVHAAAIKNKVYTLVGTQEKYCEELLIFELLLLPRETRVVKTECIHLPEQLRQEELLKMQLVQFSDDILLISSYYSSRNPDNQCLVGELQVYKLDLDGRKWDEVEDLGGCALFLSSNGSVVCREPGRWGDREDSIYFIEPIFKTSWSLYSLKTASVEWNSSNTPPTLYHNAIPSCPPWIPRELCF